MITFVNVIFVIFAILQPGIGPDCKFSSEIFIDSAVVLRLVSDKCTVRFLPASKSLWPSERDYGITSLKFKIAIQTHLDIKLETDLCFAAPDAIRKLVIGRGTLLCGPYPAALGQLAQPGPGRYSGS